MLNSGIAHYLSKDLAHNKRSKYHWACSQNNQRFDVVYVGSSRVEMTVDPRVIDASLGTTSINIGASGAGAGDQFLLTSHLLNQNAVQTVLFQVDYLSLADKFTYPFKDYIWLCYDNNTNVRQTLIDHCGHLRYAAWRYLPFLRLMEFSSQYRLFAPPSNSDYLDERKGGLQRDTPFDPSKRDLPAVYEPQSLPTAYVRKTIELCKQQNIQLVLFQAPYRSTLQEVSQYPECSRLIRKLAAEYDLKYWDFSDLYYTRPELFNDNHHLNSKGVQQFSQVLSKRIKDASLINVGMLEPSTE